MGWVHQHGYDLCMQDDEYSCAMACAAMVINRRTGSKPSESAIKGLSKQGSGMTYTPSMKDKLKSMGGVSVMPGVTPTNKGTAGTGMDNIKSILDAVKITNNFQHSVTIGTLLTGAQHQYPIVGHVVWAGSSAHFIMVDWFDATGTKKLIIMDPAYGIVMNDASATYKPNSTTSGTFSGWYIKTS
jgi:hypothetical protein